MIRSMLSPGNGRIVSRALGRHVSSSAVVAGQVASFAKTGLHDEGSFRELHHAKNSKKPSGSVWSGELSYATPEADFTSQTVPRYETTTTASTDQTQEWNGPIWSGQLLYASPESDWCAETIMPPLFASTLSRLPRTYGDALVEDDAAVVITTAAAPHNIVHVNHAWEELCGFEEAEVLGRPLSILQGPDTNAKLADATVNRLVEKHEPVDMYLVNYRKSGDSFTNRVSMGPLKMDADSPDIDFLVGILEEVRADQVPLRMVAY